METQMNFGAPREKFIGFRRPALAFKNLAKEPARFVVLEMK